MQNFIKNQNWITSSKEFTFPTYIDVKYLYVLNLLVRYEDVNPFVVLNLLIRYEDVNYFIVLNILIRFLTL